jgi:hypothetical protein
MTTPPEPVQNRPAVRTRPRPIVGLFVVGASLAVWWPAFVFGAWKTLFFDQLLTVWVASAAALAVLLLQPRPMPGRAWRAVLLLVPSLWLGIEFVPLGEDPASIALDIAVVVLAIVGLPFSLWVLLRLVWPDAGADVPRRRVVLAFAAIGIIAIACFTLGWVNPLYLHCGDFEIAGMSLPPGCTP